MKNWLVLLLVLVTAFRLSAQQKGETVSDVFVSSRNDSLPFQFVASEGMDTAKSYPLILWLHGKGERGRENAKQMTLIKKWLVDSIQKENYKSFILAPQCNETEMWSNYDKLAKQISFDTITPEIQNSIMELIRDLKLNYPIDTSRIYLMGISMGGFGVFDMVTRNPGYFAAAIPICGGADPNQAEKLVKTPIWAFHGEKDAVVDKRHTVVPMEMIEDSTHILTKYPETGHNAWIKAFKEKDLLRWMFGQKIK
jgi:predicted peptidase